MACCGRPCEHCLRRSVCPPGSGRTTRPMQHRLICAGTTRCIAAPCCFGCATRLSACCRIRIEQRDQVVYQRSLIATHRSHCHGRAWPGHPRLPHLRRPIDVGGRPKPGHGSRRIAPVIINEVWYVPRRHPRGGGYRTATQAAWMLACASMTQSTMSHCRAASARAIAVRRLAGCRSDSVAPNAVDRCRAGATIPAPHAASSAGHDGVLRR